MSAAFLSDDLVHYNVPGTLNMALNPAALTALLSEENKMMESEGCWLAGRSAGFVTP